MSKSRALHTPEEIIARGEEIEHRDGPGVEPWAIYTALGKRGNFTRLEKIWEGHRASRAGLPTQADLGAPAVDALPETLVAGLDTAFGAAQTAVRALLVGEDQRRTTTYVRQMQAVERRHADELADRDRQIIYWRAQAIEAAEQLDELHEELDAANAWAEDLEDQLDEAVAERDDARREAAGHKAVLAARRLDLPVGGDAEPLVLPVRMPMPPEAPRPEPVSEASRRARGRLEGKTKSAGETLAPHAAALPQAGSDVLPGQLAMPI